MPSYFFTFGSNHLDNQNHSLGNSYVVITASTESDARDIIMAARGPLWAFSYPSAEAAGVSRFNLKEVSLNQVTLYGGNHGN